MPSSQVARYNERQAALAAKVSPEPETQEDAGAAAIAAADAEAAEVDTRPLPEVLAAAVPAVEDVEVPVQPEASPETVQDVLDQALAEGILEERVIADPSVTSARITETADGERVLVEVIAGIDDNSTITLDEVDTDVVEGKGEDAAEA